MTIKGSGQLGLNGVCTGGAGARDQIATEVGDTPQTQAALNDANLRSLAVKASGIIRFSDFYGKSSVTYTPALRVLTACTGYFSVPTCTPANTTYYWGMVGGGAAGYGTLVPIGTQTRRPAYGYGGGGGGNFIQGTLTVNPGCFISWTIGSGGAGTSYVNNCAGSSGAGNPGGASYLYQSCPGKVTPSATAAGGGVASQGYGGTSGSGYSGGSRLSGATSGAGGGGSGGAGANTNSPAGGDGGAGSTRTIGGYGAVVAGGGGGGGGGGSCANTSGGAGGGGGGAQVCGCGCCEWHMTQRRGVGGTSGQGGGGGGSAWESYKFSGISQSGSNGGAGGIVIWG